MTNGTTATMPEQSLDPGAVVELSVGLRGLEVDDDLILTDLLSDRSFRLNATGRRIWLLLDERRTVGEVAGALQGEYGLAPDEAHAVASGYIAQLSELGLAAIQGETSSA